MLEPADAAAQLVKLRQTEAVGAFDDDRVAVGDIQAALDDGRADQDLVVAGDEVGHDPLQPVLVPSGRGRRRCEAGQQLAQTLGDRVDRQDAVVQEKTWPPRRISWRMASTTSGSS